jgi:hypothetical protein
MQLCPRLGSFRFCWSRGTTLALCLVVTFRENRCTLFPEALWTASRPPKAGEPTAHQERARPLKCKLKNAGLPVLDNPSHTVPVMIGDPVHSKQVSDALFAACPMSLAAIEAAEQGQIGDAAMLHKRCGTHAPRLALGAEVS